MFTEVQRDYIKQMVLSNSDYPYYLAYTKTNISNSYSYDDYNFYLILSKEKITASSRYKYDLGSDYIVLGVRSGNASYNYHAERIANVNIGKSFVISEYEFVYTNAEFETYAMQPDLLATLNVQQSHFDGFAIAVLILVCTIIFAHIVRGK